MPAPATVFIIDDHPESRQALAEALAPNDYRLLSYGDLVSGLKATNHHLPDLVLLAATLPADERQELAPQFKIASTYFAPLLILLSDVAQDPAVAEETAQQPFDGLILRPIVPAALRTQIGLLLRLRHSEQAMHMSRADLYRVLASSNDAVLVVDDDHQVRYANPASARILGRPLDALLGEPFGLPLVGAEPSEITLLRPGRGPGYAQMQSVYTQWENAPAHVVFMRDITLQKKAEARIEQLNAMLHAVRRVNQIIVNETDRQTLIDQTSVALREQLHDYYTWIVLVDGEQRIQHFAIASDVPAQQNLRARFGRNELPTCARKALQANGPMLIDNLGIDCQDCPLEDNYHSHAAISQRIAFEDRTYGVITVSLPNEHANDPEVQALFGELAGDLGLGLNKIETTEAMLLSQEALAESRRTLANLLANMPGMAYRCRNDRSWTMLFVSQGCYKLTGYSTNDLLHNRRIAYVELVHPNDRERVWDEIQIAVRTEQAFEVEYRIITAAGEERWVAERGIGIDGDDHDTKNLEGFVYDATERKLFELELAEREQYFRRLHEQMPVPYQALDAEGRILAINQIWLASFGYETAELIGKPFAELLQPTSQRAFQQQFTQLQQQGFSHNISLSLLSQAGKVREVLFEARAAFDHHGQLQQVHCVLLDQTEQRATERALHESEAQFRSIFDHAPVGIALVDREGKPLLSNPALQQILGYTGHELAAMPFTAFTHQQDRDKDLAQYERLYADEIQHYEMETRYLHKNGQVIWGHLTVSMMRDDAGKPVSAIGMLMDITKRREDLEQLRQAAAVFRSTSEGVVITDADTRILAVNRAFSEITGYSEAEILGQTPRLLQSGHHDDAFFAAMWRSIQETDSWHGEIWNRRKNGEIYPEWLAISTVRNEAGALVNYVGVFSDITTVKDAQAKLEYQAHHDPLTGLPNRIMFRDRVNRAIARAQRHGHVACLMFIDLDRFKDINDSLGHAVGDQVLIEIAERLQQRLRGEDSVSRHGGDEFTVLIESLKDARQAARFAKKILPWFEQPILIDEHELYITASIGISSFPGDGDSPEILIRNADTAMYQAKASGRNTYAYYDAKLTEQAMERVHMEAALRKAIDQGQLFLQYQPQVRCDTGEVTGVEALVRWQHPELGLYSPGRFIPLAEETGLIIPLGEWVLQTATRQLQAWQAQGIELHRVAVNVAAAQLRLEHFDRVVARALEDSGLLPGCLELEITEGFLAAAPEIAPHILQRLRNLGVEIAVDDFGTGYSSLRRLKDLAVDRLKIDQGFVRGIPDDPDDLALARAILWLGHSLGLEVIAEGVEQTEQCALLAAEGCEDAQGYLYSKPLSAADLVAWLRAWQAEHPPPL